MPRAPSNSDVFFAIADPRRREILEVLARGGSEPLAVGTIVGALGLPQPAVSKHLAVLREVGIVAVTRQGRRRMYELRPDRLRQVHDWAAAFERHWAHHAERIKARAEQKAREPDQPVAPPPPPPPPAPPPHLES